MTSGEDPRESFSGTENFGLPVSERTIPICSLCGTTLERPLGWRARVEFPQVFETEALYCPKCDTYFVDLNLPVIATAWWKVTPQS
jgi:hypothetical protein